MDAEHVTDGPFTFTVDGRTYVGHFDGSFLDEEGNELPHEVGIELHAASLEEDSRPASARRSALSPEQVFTITGSTAVRAPRSSLGESDLLERHLQQWVKQYPTILGEKALIVTEEFDRWTTASGDSTADRLDLLALAPDGTLIVAELKRHRAPDAVLVQALNYAAMASRFDLDLLARAHAHFLSKPGEADVGVEEALERLRAWAPRVSDETLAPPRIVLVAEDYGPVLTNTAIYLLERQLDLRLIRVGLHRIAGDVRAMTSTQVLPVPQASDFIVRPGVHPRRAAGGARNPMIERLVELVDDGTELEIVVPPVGEARTEIDTWLRETPTRRRVTWRSDARRPIEWALDGTRWAMRDLIRHLITEATGEDPRTGIWGPNWFVAPDGRTLARIDKDERGTE